MSYRLGCLSFVCASLFFCLTIASFAQNKKAASDRTQTGSDIRVGPNDETGELTCFGCSIHVRGHVLGDVTTFGGSVVVEEGGQVDRKSVV